MGLHSKKPGMLGVVVFWVLGSLSVFFSSEMVKQKCHWSRGNGWRKGRNQRMGDLEAIDISR